MAHLSSSPESVRKRLADSRHAARCAERESVVLRAAVEQQLAGSRDCLRRTADLLSQVRRRLQP